MQKNWHPNNINLIQTTHVLFEHCMDCFSYRWERK